MSKNLTKKFDLIDKCISAPEKLRSKLKEVMQSLERTDGEMIDLIEKSHDVGDMTYNLNQRMEQMICCSICQILHGHTNNVISRTDALQLISLFITDPTRVSNLFTLAYDGKCHHDEIKEAIKLQAKPVEKGSFDINDEEYTDIKICGQMDSENNESMAPAVNRIELFKFGYPEFVKMLETINYGRTNPVTDHKAAESYSSWAFEFITKLCWKPGASQPHICNHHHEQPNGPYNFNYKVFTPDPNGVPLPSTVSALKIAQGDTGASTVNTGVGWTPMSAVNNALHQQNIKINPNKLNDYWKIIELSLEFPEGTSPATRDGVIQKIFDNYGHYVRLINQMPSVKKYNVELIDENNFVLSGMNPDKTLKAVMEIKGNVIIVRTDPVNQIPEGINMTQVKKYFNDIYHTGMDPKAYDLGQILQAKEA